MRAALALSLLFVPGVSAAGLEQGNEPSWHAAQVWRQPQGLPQDTVLSLIQTRDGYLWVGTLGGLSRFDGVHFTNFDDRDKRQLRETEIWALAEGNDASLWIGTFGGGLSRFKDGRFTVYGTREGLINDFVTSLCVDRDGGIWIGTDRGLSHFKNDRFTNYTVKDGLQHDAIRGLYTDRDGSVWVGTRQGGLNRIIGGKIEAPRAEGPRPTKIHFIDAGQKGDLWIGTTNGLDRYSGSTFTSSKPLNESSSADVLALIRDREGNVWLGYRNLGLARVRARYDLLPEQRDDLNMVKLSADSLLMAINDVLDFSKSKPASSTSSTSPSICATVSATP